MDYQAAKQQEKRLKAEISRLRKDLEAAVKPYGEAMAGEYKVRLGTSTRNGFDSKKFKEEHPDLAKEYLKTSSFTRLYVS
jgi:predicted phage-related endonuclease